MCDVNVVTGELVRFESDALLPGYIPLEILRTNSSSSTGSNALGHGWKHNLIALLRRRGSNIAYVDPWGVEIPLSVANGKKTLADAARSYTLELRGDGYVLEGPDGLRSQFPASFDASGASKRVLVTDRFGNRMAYQYDFNGRLSVIQDTLDRRLEFRHDVRGRLGEILLVVVPGRTKLLRRYCYDATDDLARVEDALGRTVRYDYSDHLLVR